MKKFISRGEIGYGEVSSPSHPNGMLPLSTVALAFHVAQRNANDSSFPFTQEALNLNYLII